MPKFSLPSYMQLTCTIKKLFHFKREIADAKILHFDLGAKAPGVSTLGPHSKKAHLMQMLKSNSHEMLRSTVFALFPI